MSITILKFKIIFSGIILIAVFALAGPVSAQSADILDIEFESGINSETGLFYPLFTEANILPGESVTRWVQVTNNTNNSIPIAAKAVNAVDNGLGSALILTITEQGAGITSSSTLADFWAGRSLFI